MSSAPEYQQPAPDDIRDWSNISDIVRESILLLETQQNTHSQAISHLAKQVKNVKAMHKKCCHDPQQQQQQQENVAPERALFTTTSGAASAASTATHVTTADAAVDRRVHSVESSLRQFQLQLSTMSAQQQQQQAMLQQVHARMNQMMQQQQQQQITASSHHLASDNAEIRSVVNSVLAERAIEQRQRHFEATVAVLTALIDEDDCGIRVAQVHVPVAQEARLAIRNHLATMMRKLVQSQMEAESESLLGFVDRSTETSRRLFEEVEKLRQKQTNLEQRQDEQRSELSKVSKRADSVQEQTQQQQQQVEALASLQKDVQQLRSHVSTVESVTESTHQKMTQQHNRVQTQLRQMEVAVQQTQQQASSNSKNNSRRSTPQRRGTAATENTASDTISHRVTELFKTVSSLQKHLDNEVTGSSESTRAIIAELRHEVAAVRASAEEAERIAKRTAAAAAATHHGGATHSSASHQQQQQQQMKHQLERLDSATAQISAIQEQHAKSLDNLLRLHESTHSTASTLKSEFQTYAQVVSEDVRSLREAIETTTTTTHHHHRPTLSPPGTPNRGLTINGEPVGAISPSQPVSINITTAAAAPGPGNNSAAGNNNNNNNSGNNTMEAGILLQRSITALETTAQEHSNEHKALKSQLQRAESEVSNIRSLVAVAQQMAVDAKKQLSDVETTVKGELEHLRKTQQQQAEQQRQILMEHQQQQQTSPLKRALEEQQLRYQEQQNLMLQQREERERQEREEMKRRREEAEKSVAAAAETALELRKLEERIVNTQRETAEALTKRFDEMMEQQRQQQQHEDDDSSSSSSTTDSNSGDFSSSSSSSSSSTSSASRRRRRNRRNNSSAAAAAGANKKTKNDKKRDRRRRRRQKKRQQQQEEQRRLPMLELLAHSSRLTEVEDAISHLLSWSQQVEERNEIASSNIVEMEEASMRREQRIHTEMLSKNDEAQAMLREAIAVITDRLQIVETLVGNATGGSLPVIPSLHRGVGGIFSNNSATTTTLFAGSSSNSTTTAAAAASATNNMNTDAQQLQLQQLAESMHHLLQQHRQLERAHMALEQQVVGSYQHLQQQQQVMLQRQQQQQQNAAAGSTSTDALSPLSPAGPTSPGHGLPPPLTPPQQQQQQHPINSAFGGVSSLFFGGQQQQQQAQQFTSVTGLRSLATRLASDPIARQELQNGIVFSSDAVNAAIAAASSSSSSSAAATTASAIQQAECRIRDAVKSECDAAMADLRGEVDTQIHSTASELKRTTQQQIATAIANHSKNSSNSNSDCCGSNCIKSRELQDEIQISRDRVTSEVTSLRNGIAKVRDELATVREQCANLQQQQQQSSQQHQQLLLQQQQQQSQAQQQQQPRSNSPDRRRQIEIEQQQTKLLLQQQKQEQEQKQQEQQQAIAALKEKVDEVERQQVRCSSRMDDADKDIVRVRDALRSDMSELEKQTRESQLATRQQLAATLQTNAAADEERQQRMAQQLQLAMTQRLEQVLVQRVQADYFDPLLKRIEEVAKDGKENRASYTELRDSIAEKLLALSTVVDEVRIGVPKRSSSSSSNAAGGGGDIGRDSLLNAVERRCAAVETHIVEETRALAEDMVALRSRFEKLAVEFVDSVAEMKQHVVEHESLIAPILLRKIPSPQEVSASTVIVAGGGANHHASSHAGSGGDDSQDKQQQQQSSTTPLKQRADNINSISSGGTFQQQQQQTKLPGAFDSNNKDLSGAGVTFLPANPSREENMLRQLHDSIAADVQMHCDRLIMQQLSRKANSDSVVRKDEVRSIVVEICEKVVGPLLAGPLKREVDSLWKEVERISVDFERLLGITDAVETATSTVSFSSRNQQQQRRQQQHHQQQLPPRYQAPAASSSRQHAQQVVDDDDEEEEIRQQGEMTDDGGDSDAAAIAHPPTMSSVDGSVEEIYAEDGDGNDHNNASSRDAMMMANNLGLLPQQQQHRRSSSRRSANNSSHGSSNSADQQQRPPLAPPTRHISLTELSNRR